MKQLNQKGDIMDVVIGLVIGVVVIAIVLGLSLLIFAGFNGVQAVNGCSSAFPNYVEATNLCFNTAGNVSVAGSSASAGINSMTSILATLPSWVSIVVIASIGIAILGLVLLLRNRGGN